MGKGRPRIRILILSLILLLLWQFLPTPAPTQIPLSKPKVLLSGLKLLDAPSQLLWSPDGRYLAVIAADFPSTEVTVIDTASNHVAGRVTAGQEALQRTTWASDGGLWIGSKVGWDLYRAPFTKPHGERTTLPGGTVTDSGEVAFHPDSQVIVEVLESDASSDLRLRARKAGRPFRDLTFRPREPGGYREPAGLAFSPDGTHAAFTVVGWVGYEQDGRDELWMFDTATGTLRFLRAGGSKWWGLFDYPVQSVIPAWAPDSRTITFGDSTFGVEALDVSTGRRKRLLPPNWGDEARTGHDWVAYQPELGPGSVAVVSRDGRWWGRMPEESGRWRVGAYEWDRTGQRLALIGGDFMSPGYSVLLWQVQRR